MATLNAILPFLYIAYRYRYIDLDMEPAATRVRCRAYEQPISLQPKFVF